MNAAVQGFRELDDLVLHLKGLVIVQGLREQSSYDQTLQAMIQLAK